MRFYRLLAQFLHFVAFVENPAVLKVLKNKRLPPREGAVNACGIRPPPTEPTGETAVAESD